ncbi:dethiobiotin synthase [Cylindrospermopsis raciborskii]|uniref:dethiobiotin synthase n=1 Tax=Cylindrospermopsis raciborskii TaxID=77022 RepID=UPI000778D817|nr:dethiobiotin synthase [Cylindrospermopsis raciborskii]
MSNTLLIAGTDTGAGKTLLTCSIAAYWLKYFPQSRLGIMKPLQSGIGDKETYQSLFNLDQSEEEITPLYFQAPLAPPIAAAKENRTIDLGLVWRTFLKLQRERDFLLVESLGGLGSPVTDELTVADLAGEWRLPTVLVVPVRLGAIAQAVANAALARQAKINLLGIVLNCNQPRSEEEMSDLTPTHLIESLTNFPVLGCLPYLEDVNDLEALAELGSNLTIPVWSRLQVD